MRKTTLCLGYPPIEKEKKGKKENDGGRSMTDHAYSWRTVWEVKLWRQRVIERRTGHYVWMFEGKQAAINSGVHRGCSSRRGMTSSGRCAENAPAFLSLSLSLSPSHSCVFVYTSESGGSNQKARYTRIDRRTDGRTDRCMMDRERET